MPGTFLGNSRGNELSKPPYFCRTFILVRERGKVIVIRVKKSKRKRKRG